MFSHCEEGYTVFETRCFKNPHCISRKEDGRCSQCDEHYTVLSEDLTACIYHPSCNVTDSNGLCSRCIGDNTLVLQDKYSICTPNPHCLITVSGKCQKCEDGYTVRLDGMCVEHKECQTVCSNTGRCKECKEGYTRNETYMCVRNEQCTSVNEYGECQGCNTSHILINKVCVKDEHCNNWGLNSCYECERGYTPSTLTSLCVKNENCEFYVSNRCRQCKEGYFFDKSLGDVCVEESNCQFNDGQNHCRQCNDGYTLDPNSYLCVKNEHCGSESESMYKYCTSCEDGYSMSIDGKNVCVKSDHCIAKDNTGKCELCESDYTIDKSTGLCA